MPLGCHPLEPNLLFLLPMPNPASPQAPLEGEQRALVETSSQVAVPKNQHNVQGGKINGRLRRTGGRVCADVSKEPTREFVPWRPSSNTDNARCMHALFRRCCRSGAVKGQVRAGYLLSV